VHSVHFEPHAPSDVMDAIAEELAAMADGSASARVVLPSTLAQFRAFCCEAVVTDRGGNVAVGRKARVHGSRLEGPESPPKQPFRCESGVRFTA
jgi:hypothetical protein